MKLMPPSDLEQIAGGGAYQAGTGISGLLARIGPKNREPRLHRLRT